MTCLKSFLTDLNNNTSAKKVLGLGTSMMTELQNEAEHPCCPKTWVEATITNNPLDDLPDIGVVLSRYIDGNEYVYGPVAIKYVGDELWVCNYNSGIRRFDSNFSYLGRVTRSEGTSANASNNTIYNPIDFIADLDNDILVVALHSRHMIKALKISDGSLLWVFGDGTAGYPYNNRSYSPIGLDWLPNGNIVVVSYNAYGKATSTNRGCLYELNVADGTYVQTHLDYEGTGQIWDGHVYRPRRARVYDGKIYVTNYDYDQIGVWDVTTTPWTYLDIYTKPLNLPVGSIYPWLAIPDGNELLISCASPNMIVGIDLLTHDLKWMTGHTYWDDMYNGRNLPGELYTVRDFVVEPSGSLLVCDYGNNRIQRLPRFDQIEVTYDWEDPDGYELKVWDEKLNTTTKKKKFLLSEKDNIKPVYLGYTKTCTCDS